MDPSKIPSEVSSFPNFCYLAERHQSALRHSWEKLPLDKKAELWGHLTESFDSVRGAGATRLSGYDWYPIDAGGLHFILCSPTTPIQ